MVTWRPASMLVTATLLSLLLVTACSNDRDRESGPDKSADEAALVSAINQQLSIDPDHDNLRAVVVYVDGDPILENYYGWSADTYWDVESVTKSILSTLVGIAIGEGKISDLDRTLAQLLPDHRADMRRAVATTTLRELVTMTAGFAGLDRDRTPDYMTDPDPVGRILRAAPDPLAGGFEYSNQGAHLVSAVVARATGMSVLDYARSRLFEPLGIDTHPAVEPQVDLSDLDVHDVYMEADFAWPVDRSGLHLGWGLVKLRPTDMARLGQLFLQDGLWKGKQVVPASWVREATRSQVAETGDQFGYGYEWWVDDRESDPAYFAFGYGGQMIAVVPNWDLVVVVSSEVEPDGNAGTGISSNTLAFLVHDVIVPAVAR